MNKQFAWQWLVTICLAFVFTAAVLAAPTVSNISAQQQAGTKLVNITYDVVSPSNLLTITVLVSTDNGVTYDLPATSFSGAGYGSGVTPGTDKQIIWDAGADWNGQYSDKVWFKITADDSVAPGEYLVIDLSGGSSASSYPVSYLAAVPSGGWTDEYKTTKLVLRRIPAGTFTMGSPSDELGRVSDETQHQVTWTKDFYIGVFEVTQKQWERVTGTWRSYFSNATYRDSRPMDGFASYYDIRENPNNSPISPNWPASAQVHADSFMGKLRTKTGLTTLDLPTESQWEYACRAGTKTALNSGKNLTDNELCPNMAEVGRYGYLGECNENSATNVGTAKVGSYLANQWGLYDMHGNVWELCLDWYGTYPGAGTVTDPAGAASGSSRVKRGGGWTYNARYCRSANRDYGPPSTRFVRDGGFRVAMTLP